MSKEISKNNTDDFGEILSIIGKARENTFRAVNRELISMYWDIGKYISEKVKINGWGKSVVSDFADFVQNQYVGIKGFSSQNIWRMKQFYETYFENEKLSALLREISWTNNLTIMSRTKSAEAREFWYDENKSRMVIYSERHAALLLVKYCLFNRLGIKCFRSAHN